MLRRRSIRSRIIVLVVVPILALLGLYAVVLNLTLGKLLTLKQEASIRQLVALPVADVQVQIGKERTLALQYLASPDHGDMEKLLLAEHRTDVSIRHYRDAVQTALNAGPVAKERQAFLSWRAALGGINALRAAVASQALSTYNAAKAYSALMSGGNGVLNQAIIPVLTGPLGIQAIDVLTMARATQAMGEERDLVRADLIARTFPRADLALISQLVVQRSVEWSRTLPQLDPNLRRYLTTMIPHTAVRQITRMESLISSGPAGARTISLRKWTDAQEAYHKGSLAALLKCAAVLASESTSQADGLALNLILVAALGLLAIVAAVTVGSLVGRALVMQLTGLRESAVALSSEQLPGAIARLRAGEDVSVAAEVPELQASGDEIGQVHEAFNTAARTAIAAAVDEVKIRRSVNDVFRSLARRNQSLLTRQLQLLDSMERRVHDPEDLADLFRVDHLTTRMRRHAEGLLIVAGGSSGRTWREPVPLVDVMRAAVAEVEDYTRIRVASRTSVAVAGHAVADIIHLLAELVENATLFSPASTPVRIDGDKVARGVVVEIEDRGLGMDEAHLASVNALLADPPLFDMSGSDQLGLFIAGQLAKRHDIKVSLRESPYGGIVAVVLIPRSLTVDVDETGPPAAITNIRELGGRPVPQLPVGSPEPGGPAQAGAGETAANGYLVGSEAHQRTAALADRTSGRDAGQSAPASPSAGRGEWPVPPTPLAAPFDQGDHDGADRGTVADPGEDSQRAPEPSLHRPAEPGPIWNDSIQDGSGPGEDRPESSMTMPADLVDLDGLPMRIPQASLAPQLRRGTLVVQPVRYPATSGPSPSSPEEARNLMTALQRGWERGRASESVDDASGTAGSLTQPPGDNRDEEER